MLALQLVDDPEYEVGVFGYLEDVFSYLGEQVSCLLVFYVLLQPSDEPLLVVVGECVSPHRGVVSGNQL